MPCLGSSGVGQLPDDRHHLLAVRDVELPHEEVHRLLEAGALAQLAVVGRVPGLADHRRALVALDQHAALVVHREVHRAHHAVAAALAQPARGGVEQRRERLRVLLQLEEPEHAPGVVVELVEGDVDLRAHPTDDPPVAPGQEQLGLAVLEVGVEARIEEQPPLDAERGHPLLAVRVQPVRELDEGAPILARDHGRHLHGHGAGLYADGDRSLREGTPPRAARAASGGARARPDALLPGAGGPGRPRGRAWRAPSGSCSARTTTSGSRATSA